VPLSAYGRPYAPPPGRVAPAIDMRTAVRKQVNRMSAVEYFTLLAQLMKANPPAPADAPHIARFARIGLVPGQDFDASKLRADFASRIPAVSFDRIMIQFRIKPAVKDINGWGFTARTGIYGTDYLMRFAPGQLPPVQGFWSLTMCAADYFFVANPINRYPISARQDLKRNADGSVVLHIQHASPGADRESNWLPAPAGKFVLMMRLYWPNEADPSILAGSWTIPPVTKL
jgi:hypothetical protein